MPVGDEPDRAASAGERCAGVASTLRALSLGWEIAGRRRTRLERHLATCPACRATVAALRREGRLAALPVVLADTPADGLVERAAQVAARAWDRAPAGSAEASAGVLGGALATKVVAGCVAPPREARTRSVAARPSERVRRARSRVRDAARSVRRAQRRTERAVQRTQEAQQQVQRAQRRTQQAQEKTQQAEQRIAEAQAKVERATTGVEQALEKAFGGAP